MERFLSQVGARLGNWNDRTNAKNLDTRNEYPRRWRVLDRIAGWLYKRGDR